MAKTREELMTEMATKLENAEVLREIAIPGVVEKISPDANKVEVK